MIITPEQLKKWSENAKNFTLLDTRPKKEIKQSPIKELEYIISTPDSIRKLKGDKVLVCQFGIVTEGMIIATEGMMIADLHRWRTLAGSLRRRITSSAPAWMVTRP